MSRKSASSLHIEWTPGYVRAVDIAAGQAVTGGSLDDLGSLLERHRRVLVGIGRGLVFWKALRLPKASQEDLRRILETRLAQFFPLPPDQLAFDFIQTTDQTAEGFLTIVSAVRTEDLKRLRRDLQRANLTAARILPVALGALAAASQAGMDDALLLEDTPAGLALDVVLGGALRFSRMAPRDSDPSCEAQRTLAAAHAGSLPLLALGGQESPEALSVSGTALERLHEAPPFDFELIEDRVRETRRRAAARMRVAALMLLAAILLAALVWTERSDVQAAARRGEADWATQLSRLRSAAAAETARAQRAASVMAAQKRAFEPAQPLSDLAAVVDDSLPPGAWLTGLSIERGKPLQMRGAARTADDVARFMDTLGATSRFRDVKLVFANSARIDETPVVQFSVTAVGVGNLPMPAPVKQARRGARTPKSSRDSRMGGER